MATVKVEVSVSKESYELGQGLVKFAGAIQGALKNGWQPGQDLPVILSAVMADLIPAFTGVDKVSGEFDEARSAFLKAWALAGVDMVDLFFPASKPVPVPAPVG